MLSRTAVRQAMHFSFGLTFAQIGRLESTSSGSMIAAIMGRTGKSWQTRPESERTEAIAAAKATIKAGERAWA